MKRFNVILIVVTLVVAGLYTANQIHRHNDRTAQQEAAERPMGVSDSFAPSVEAEPAPEPVDPDLFTQDESREFLGLVRKNKVKVHPDAEDIFIRVGEQVCRSMGEGLSAETVMMSLMDGGASAREALIVTGAATATTGCDQQR